jgi:pimeloyl-ACP methyl ester carboxylesterase
MSEPFCQTAANLRRAMQAALETVDKDARDPALRQMVLIGHSMGGLIAKCQVVSSGDALWRSVSRLPLESLVADEDGKNELREQFCFEPQPWVRRVVFIATPHDGCSRTQVRAARLADCIAGRDPALAARYEPLLRANPGVFAREVQQNMPTHVDLLEPDSGLLRAIRARPICPGVHVHSVIGDACRMGCDATGDGVVTVSSASHPAESELYLRARHTRTHHDFVTLAEIVRILQAHLAEFRDAAP